MLKLKVRICEHLMYHIPRVTRFGYISPLWQKIKGLWAFFGVYTIFGKFLSSLGQTLYAFIDVDVLQILNK